MAHAAAKRVTAKDPSAKLAHRQMTMLELAKRLRNELIAGQAGLERVVGPLLQARTALRTADATLHHALLEAVREDEVCPRLMTVPGVGAVVAMTFKAGPA
jgi:transposase